MCIRRETREKARRSLAFSRVSKPHTHITHMLRQCTSIVYIFDYFLSRTNTNSKWWKIKPKIPKVPKNSTKPYNLNVVRDLISKRGWLHWDIINRFTPATFLCLSQYRTWISNVTCRGLFLCTMRR